MVESYFEMLFWSQWFRLIVAYLNYAIEKIIKNHEERNSCKLPIWLYTYCHKHDEFTEVISEPWDNLPLVSFDMLDYQRLIFSPFDLNDKFYDPLHYVITVL